MSLIENDLLAALKELRETSMVINSDTSPSVNEMERYYKALEWAKRVIALAEGDK